MIKNKNILITGGTGFIGSALKKVLEKENNITTVNLSGSCDVKLDLATQDRTELDKITKDQNIVIHCAAVAGIDRTIKDPIDTLETNLFGTYNVLCSAAKAKNIEKVIIFSTSEIFGDSYNAQEVNGAKIGSVGKARWTYAISKLAGEHFAYAFYKKYNLPIVIVRPFNIFGPGQIGEGAMHTFICQALKNETITINGDGSQIRAWCYIDDMVEAIMKILDPTKEVKTFTVGDTNLCFNTIKQDFFNVVVGQSFNIGNKRSTITILNLAKLIVRLLNSQSKIVHVDSLGADIEMRIPNVDKARNILCFEAKVDLEEGILKTAEFYQDQERESS